MTLETLKSDIAALGYKMSTKTLSWGPHVTYVHKESKARLTYNVFTSEVRALWEPLLDYIAKNRAELVALGKEAKIYGLVN